jgi:hypothetical protein
MTSSRFLFVAAALLAGIALVLVGGLNLEEPEVINCVTAPCPQDEAPVWPKLAIAAGGLSLAVSAYLAIKDG